MWCVTTLSFQDIQNIAGLDILQSDLHSSLVMVETSLNEGVNH
jgi:hypothetical protein